MRLIQMAKDSKFWAWRKRQWKRDEEHGVSGADRAWVAQCKKYGEDPLACERTDSEKQNLEDSEEADNRQQELDF